MTQRTVVPEKEEGSSVLTTTSEERARADLLQERQAGAVGELLESAKETLSSSQSSPGLSLNDRSLTLTFDGHPHLLIQRITAGERIPLGERNEPRKRPGFELHGARSDLDEALSALDRDAEIFRHDYGAHALFLTVGSFRDAENIERPLLSIPVRLSWNSSTSRWELFSTGADPEYQEEAAARSVLRDSCDGPATGPQAERTEHLNLSKLSLGLYGSSSKPLLRDLDPTVWPPDRSPLKHSFLTGLVTGCLRHQTPPPHPEGSSQERYWVLGADSSQQAALLKAQSGEHSLIQGPPGSGKSTTIVNLTADALARGKRVLIVSEKLDALRVAKHWLDHAGIGDTSLLVEPSASRKEVALEIARTLKLGRPHRPDRAAKVSAYDRALGFFTARAQQLTAPVGKSTHSTYEVLANSISLSPTTSSNTGPRVLKDPCMLAWDEPTLTSVKNAVSRLEKIYVNHGHPRHLPLVRRSSRSQDLSAELGRLSTSTHAALDAYLSEAQTLFSTLGIQLPRYEQGLGHALETLRVIDGLYSENGALVKGTNHNVLKSAEHQTRAIAALERQRQLAETIEKAQGSINFGNLAVCDLNRISTCISQHKTKFFKLLDGDYTYALESLRRITEVPRTLPEQEALVKRLTDIKKLLAERDEDDALFRAILGDGWDRERGLLGERRFWQRTSQLVHALVDYERAVAPITWPAPYLELLRSPERVYGASDRIYSTMLLKAGYEKERAALFERLGRSSGEEPHAFSLQPLDEQEKQLSVWRFHPEGFTAAEEYGALCDEIEKLGATTIRKLIEESGDFTNLAASIERGYFATLSERILRAAPLVSGFNKDELLRERAALERTHADLLKANAEEIAFKHWERLPRHRSGGDVARLLNETEKRSGFTPLRELFSETSEALQRVKPVLLMSPSTAAKMLDPAALEFDIVIFDEASQVRPSHAIGAIARGKQVIAVGDPQQLDPTSFFERKAEDASAEPVRSLIDLAQSAGLQPVNLAWHYRSRFPGLIQPSNEAFYGGRLHVFPAPHKGEGADGFVYRHIARATYDLGGSRTNEVEAKAVARAVLEHARTRPQESLGVVALSRAQMDAIAHEVDILRRKEPVLDRFISRDTREAFFIKNLETSQGVERDRIFISIGYARTVDGKLSLNFGPLNNERGGNRLNVLLSRARTACEVFTALKPDEPEFEGSSNLAVQTLNRLLRRMTETVVLQQGSLNSTDLDPLKDGVRRLLEKQGYTVHSSVGQSGQGVDLAVVDKHNPERYLLGIIFDTPSSEGSIEDREIIRPQALRDRGWTVVHQSVVEWFKDPSQALATLERALVNAAIPAADGRNNHSDEVSAGPREVVRSNVPIIPPALAKPYECAKVHVQLGEALRRGDAKVAHSELTRAFREIATIEAPLHRVTMRERMSEVAGALRFSDNFDETLEEIEAKALESKQFVIRDEFIYPTAPFTIALRDRSSIRGAAKDFGNVPREEVELSIIKAVQTSLRIRKTELTETALRLFGYSRIPSGADTVVQASLATLISSGAVTESGDFLCPPRHT